jgi:pimeloyl-ACP methyl ester carboxylesterase
MKSSSEKGAARPGSGPSAAERAAGVAADLRGLSRLVIDAVTGVTDIVEGMHRNISALSPIVGAEPAGGARGIAGLVYRSVRGVTRGVGWGIDKALAPFAGDTWASPTREALLAAMNGVLGDRLALAGNPLAISMTLRQAGKPISFDEFAPTGREPGSRLLILIHGLCMNDLQWRRDGHDHGAALAADLGYTPLYLHYNSGRHIAANGIELSDLLETLQSRWPVPIERIAIVGHSMGGLVARSACETATRESHAWLDQLATLTFLGTPHHGAPLERIGHLVDRALNASPYTAPLAKVGAVRSVGIKDLRYGRVDGAEDTVPLPQGVACHAVAGTVRAKPGSSKSLPGDGLVAVDSALGLHPDPALDLGIPEKNRATFHSTNHFDLLSDPKVYTQLKQWLDRPRRK